MSRIGLGIGNTQNFYNSSINWTPADIATTAWYDATVPSSITIATGVSQWNDLSGNGRHLTQGTGDDQPATNSRTINGLNVLDFGGTSDHLDANALASVYSGTDVPMGAYIIFESDDVSATKTLIHFFNSGGSAYRYILTAPAEFLARFNSDSATLANNQAGTVATGTPEIVNQVFDGTTSKLYENGTEIDSDNLAVGATTLDSFAVGAFNSGSFYWNGALGEIIFTAGTETTATRQKIEGYLAHKWGTLSLLAGGHPYKVNPPGR